MLQRWAVRTRANKVGLYRFQSNGESVAIASDGGDLASHLTPPPLYLQSDATLKNRLVLTLTTTRGSRQYSLNTLARYLLLLCLLLLLSGFLLGNILLVKTSDELSLLELDHRSLETRYQDSTELYKTELDQLSDTLGNVESERSRLEREFYSLATRYEDAVGSSQEYQHEVEQLSVNINQVESERTLWADSLRLLERKMGLPVTAQMTLERSKALQQIANERLFMLRGIPNGKPMKTGRLSDGFGMRVHPVTKERKPHRGVDWSTPRGTPVYATADGAVEYSGFHKKSGYGNLLIISHNFGFKTYYGHMDKLVVKNGSVIRKGQLVGYSGNTGVSTGPHLHYEVRYLFKQLDPKPFLQWGMENYENLFTQVKGIAWASLREMHPLNQLEAPLL